MFRIYIAATAAAVVLCGSLSAQVRVTPKEAKGGEKQGEPWAEVPESFRSLKIPDWTVPTDLKRWQGVDRAATRATLLRCLGEMPARPDTGKVKVVSKEDHDDYTLERFEFHNGVDMVVAGILLVPKNRKGRVPPSSACTVTVAQGEHLHRSQEQPAYWSHAGEARVRGRGHRFLLQR